MNVEIFKASAGNAEDIIRLSRECLSAGWSDESIKKDIERHDYFVAVEGGEVKGYACVWFMPPEAEIDDICVTADARGRGIGDMMMKFIISEAEKNGTDMINLEVRESNLPAIRLYEKNGFVREGVRKAYYDNREDALIMRWRENKGR